MKWRFALVNVVVSGLDPLTSHAAARHVAETDRLEARLRGAGLGNLGRDLEELRAARVAVAHSEAESAHDVCPFFAFAHDLDGVASVAKVSDVVFRQGSAIVVQKNETIDGVGGISRYLLFKREDGHCDEEAVVRCSAVVVNAGPGRPENSVARRAAAKGDFDRCHVQQCRPLPELELSYARSMMAGALTTLSGQGRQSPTSARGLLIGIGGGMIPLWVQESFPALALDAVDIAPEVLAAAPCFGLHGPEGGSKVQIALDDGRRYLEAEPAGRYDFVLMDAFMRSGAVPPCLSTREFVEQVRERLTPGGVLVWNVWPQEFGDVLATTSAVFADVVVGHAPGEGNRILLASDKNLTDVVQPTQTRDMLTPAVQQWYSSAAFEKIVSSVLTGGSVRSDAKLCPSGRG